MDIAQAIANLDAAAAQVEGTRQIHLTLQESLNTVNQSLSLIPNLESQIGQLLLEKSAVERENAELKEQLRAAGLLNDTSAENSESISIS